MKTDDKEAAIAAVVKIAAAAGFACSAEEYQAFVKEELARRHAAGDLNEEELSSAAGGSIPTVRCTF